MTKIALLLATLLMFGQREPKDGSIEFVVLDSMTHTGIPAVRITMVAYIGEPPFVVSTLFTDSEGRLSLKNLGYGRYSLRAEPEGYRPTDGGSSTALIALLTLSADRKNAKEQMELIPVSTFSGHVLNPNGDPLRNAVVSLLLPIYRDGTSYRVLSAPNQPGMSSATTDDRGFFRVTDVPPGNYYLRIDNGGEKNLPRVIYYPGVTESANATTVAVSAADVSLDIRVPRIPVFRISGIATSAVPMNSGGFSLESADPNSLDQPGMPTLVALTSPNEYRFEIAGVPAGNYYLFTLYPTGTCCSYDSNRVPVSVVDADVENLRITLQPGVEVKGRIILADPLAQIRWDALKVTTRLKDRSPRSPGSKEISGVAVSSNGEFALGSFIPGTSFFVDVRGLPPGAYVSDVRQGGLSVFRDDSLTASVSDRPVEIQIDLRGGTVSGTVSTATNAPAKYPVVLLIPDLSLRAASLLYKSTIADADGTFTLQGIAPGEYQVIAIPEIPPYGVGQWQDPQFLMPYAGKGTTVRVNSGATVATQLRLIP